MKIKLVKQHIGLRDHISDHFQWGEVLFLGKIGVYFYPTKIQAENMKYFIKKKVEKVRKFLGIPMVITSGIRPPEYNKLIHGAELSKHIDGLAIDFYCKEISADKLRTLLLPKLEAFDIRMENLPGSSWVHIDNGPVIRSRYFIP